MVICVMFFHFYWESSSQLTISYVSEGVGMPPTSNVLELEVYMRLTDGYLERFMIGVLALSHDMYLILHKEKDIP